LFFNEIEMNHAYDSAIRWPPRKLLTPLLFNRFKPLPVHTDMYEEMIAIIERMRAAERELEHMAAEHESHRKREYERLAARLRYLADDAENALITGVSLRLW
jgi:hypothetical protein